MSPVPAAPRYRGLRPGELAARARRAEEMLAACRLCGHRCAVDRRAVPAGRCRTAARARVHGWGPHHGEEDCLRGWRGSGTVFFSNCNLACVFCQNWEISARGDGEEIEPAELAKIFFRLQASGVHNLNLVTPSHVVAPILAALAVAAPAGLALPLVWNCGGYESLDALALLDGVVDVYMPDFKYGDAEIAARLSGAPDYPEVAAAALREMHRQVGDLECDGDGLAVRGLLVRHLVLPGGLARSERVMGILASEVSARTAVHVMDQYRPCFQAERHPPLDRRPTAEEVGSAVRAARSLGLRVLS